MMGTQGGGTEELQYAVEELDTTSVRVTFTPSREFRWPGKKRRRDLNKANCSCCTSRQVPALGKLRSYRGRRPSDRAPWTLAKIDNRATAAPGPRGSRTTVTSLSSGRLLRYSRGYSNCSDQINGDEEIYGHKNESSIPAVKFQAWSQLDDWRKSRTANGLEISVSSSFSFGVCRMFRFH